MNIMTAVSVYVKRLNAKGKVSHGEHRVWGDNVQKFLDTQQEHWAKEGGHIMQIDAATYNRERFNKGL